MTIDGMLERVALLRAAIDAENTSRELWRDKMRFDEGQPDKGVAVRTRWSQSTLDLRNELRTYAKKYSWLTYDPDMEADKVIAKKLKADKKRILTEAEKRDGKIPAIVSSAKKSNPSDLPKTPPNPSYSVPEKSSGSGAKTASETSEPVVEYPSEIKADESSEVEAEKPSEEEPVEDVFSMANITKHETK